MNAEEMLSVVGLLGLPFLGWLVVVGPLMFSATLGPDGEGRVSGREARLLLLKFFLFAFALWCLTVSLFLAVRWIGHALALV